MEEVHRAVHETVLSAEPKRLAHLMGTSHTNLLNRSNPNTDGHRLTFEQFLQILVQSGDIRPLQVLADQLGYQLVAKEPARSFELSDALLRLHAALADVTRLGYDAQADGHVCSREKAVLLKEADEVLVSIEEFKQSVKVA